MHTALDDLVRGSYSVDTEKERRRREGPARTSASSRYVLSADNGFTDDLLTYIGELALRVEFGQQLLRR